MKQKIRQKLSLLLVLAMLLTCLLPMSVLAESTAPDGIKEDAYTNAKRIRINTTYAGQGAGLRDNPYDVSSQTFFYWDDEYVYIWMDVYDQYNNNAGVVDMDVLFVRQGTSQSGTFLDSGVEWSYKRSTDTYSCNNSALEYKAAVNPQPGIRSYEFRFPRGDADGFLINPVVYGAPNYTVSYATSYLQADAAKSVSFTDESTWLDTSAYTGDDEPDPTPDPDPNPNPDPDPNIEVDGVKEDAYTNAKRVCINTTYAGMGGESRDNPYDVSSETFYYWDDTYIYIWMDIYDQYNNNTGVVDMDVLYVRAGTSQGGNFLNSGAEWSYKRETKAYNCNNSALEYKAAVESKPGIRSYEFRFPHGGEDGFLINPVVYGASTYTVSYGSTYLQADAAKVVSFTDESTWMDTSAYKGPVDPNNWIDGVREEAYNSANVLEVSTAYYGQSGNKRDNSNHVYNRTYYYWDDNFTYFWIDVYDPDGVVTLDTFYFLNGTDGIGAIFSLPNGCEVAYTPSTKTLTNQKPKQISFMLGETTQGATRSFEIALPRNADGFLFQPVSYVSTIYVVSYGSSYFSTDAAKQILFQDPSTYAPDTTAVDENVCTDFSKLTSIETALKRLPEDTSSLQESDRTLVDEVKTEVEKYPSGWLARIDSVLVRRYKAALQRMLELQAIKEADKIKAVEDLITALPATVGLSNKDMVAKAKEAYDALGELTAFVKTDLNDKLLQAVTRIATLQSPVKIDGVLDPAYSKGQNYDINLEFDAASASNVIGTDPDVYGKYYTMADENYIYLYVEVFDDSIISFPEDEVWVNHYESSYDGVITYFNPDPYNDPYSSPIKNGWDSDTKDFSFYMFANGKVDSTYIVEGKTEFLTDSTSFVSFTKDNSYGYEMRFPRVAGEEEFLLNIIITNPSADGESNRYIAVGGEWFANYLQYAQHYFEDYPQLKNYDEVAQIINSLPAADTITDTSCKVNAETAREMLDLLNVDQRALISDELVAKLVAVEEALKKVGPVTPPITKYGDLNNDNEVNALDALIALKIAVGKQKADAAMMKLADVDGNGKVNANDALLMLKKAVNRIDKFPVEETKK